MSVSVSILQTGTIRIRPSHRHQSANKPVLLRRAKAIFGDRRWTQPLPINTYLIESTPRAPFCLIQVNLPRPRIIEGSLGGTHSFRWMSIST